MHTLTIYVQLLCKTAHFLYKCATIYECFVVELYELVAVTIEFSYCTLLAKVCNSIYHATDFPYLALPTTLHCIVLIFQHTKISASI